MECEQTLLDRDSRGRLREYIQGHAARGRHLSDETRNKISLSIQGSNHWNWQGGRIKHDGGYWLILRPEHRDADRDGYILEHRFVYEENHKCCLLPWTQIHHKNGKRWDNRPENSQPTTVWEHKTLHRIDFGQTCMYGGGIHVIRYEQTIHRIPGVGCCGTWNRSLNHSNRVFNCKHRRSCGFCPIP